MNHTKAAFGILLKRALGVNKIVDRISQIKLGLLFGCLCD
jgi:hypothetical protein